MSLLVWSLILLTVGLALILLEVFVPSSGVLGVLAGLSVVAAIIVAFMQGPYVGLAIVSTTVVALPAVVALALRIWPSTSIGRRILLGVPKAEELLPDDEVTQRLKSLVGKQGVAQSLMLPSGAIRIDGRTYDATAAGVAIEPGTAVRVVEVHGARIVVRPIEEDDEQADRVAQADPGDPLSRSLESLGLEGFDQPLG